jgi:hypothetical protein
MAAARARDGQASFTAYMADDTWRALRRHADEHDVSRSSILEALLEQYLAAANPSATLARAAEITSERRRRADS